MSVDWTVAMPTMVKAADIHVDTAIVDMETGEILSGYQRQTDEVRGRRMAKEFDIRIWDHPHVSVRDDGSMWAFDGAHRVLLVIAMGEESIPVILHYGLTLEDEADLFVARQRERRPLTAFDMWVGDLMRQDAEACDLAQVLRGHRLRFVPGQVSRERGRAFRSVGTIRAQFSADPDGCNRALGVYAATWASRPSAASAFLVGGLCQFVSASNPDLGRLTEMLRHWSPMDAKRMLDQRTGEFRAAQAGGAGILGSARDTFAAKYEEENPRPLTVEAAVGIAVG